MRSLKSLNEEEARLRTLFFGELEGETTGRGSVASALERWGRGRPGRTAVNAVEPLVLAQKAVNLVHVDERVFRPAVFLYGALDLCTEHGLQRRVGGEVVQGVAKRLQNYDR